MFNPPSVINQRYQLLRTLGAGGMGIVYLARDLLLERDVAVKFLVSSGTPDQQARFLGEARAIARLMHPHIVALYDMGSAADWHYLILEYVQGKTARELLAQQKRLDIDTALSLMTDVLTALAYAHAHGIIHRDIKPENLLISGDSHVKLTDFGLALASGAVRLTRQGDLLGTLAYMSPEQVRGDELDPRSDLYSAGVVLYELLTGSRPHTTLDTAALIQQILSAPPPPARSLNPTLPAALEDVIERLLSKRPDARYATANAVLAALRQIPRGSVSANAQPEDLKTRVERLLSSQVKSAADDPSVVVKAAAYDDTADQLEAERRRIAELLELRVIDSLSLLLAQVSAYEQTLSASPQTKLAISVVGSLTRQIMQQARDLASDLHPATLETLGLEPALEALAAQEERMRGVQVILRLQRQRERLPIRLEFAMFRAVQGALTQLTGRGSASRITLRLERTQDALVVSLIGNGQPIPADAISALRQRLANLGGDITQTGTSVLIRLPVPTSTDLTERERDVLRYLAEGMSNKEIAAALHLSPRAVKFHLDNLYSKLGVRSRTEAVIYAIRWGLLRQ